MSNSAPNRLVQARDRHRTPVDLQRAFERRLRREDIEHPGSRTLGHVNIVPGSGSLPPIRQRMVAPISPNILRPMVPPMGATAVQVKRAVFGNENLWAGTPIHTELAPSLGDPDLFDEAEDVTQLLKDWERVGWYWDHAAKCLSAFLTLAGKTYVVRVPLAKLQQIFNRSHCEQTGQKLGPYREQTLNGFFKKIGRGLKKAVKGVVKNTIKSITAPIRFVKNPKKFVKDTAQHIKKVVKGVGKTALKIASSPVFAGVMTAVAAIPPLTAVGAAGLAAFAAANAIKPAFKAAEKGIDIADRLGKRKKIKAKINDLPAPARKLMSGALKSTPAASSAGKAAFRFAGGALQKVFQ